MLPNLSLSPRLLRPCSTLQHVSHTWEGCAHLDFQWCVWENTTLRGRHRSCTVGRTKCKTEDTRSLRIAAITKMTKWPWVWQTSDPLGSRRSSIGEVLLVGWMVWELMCMQSPYSREVRGSESPKSERTERRSHYCEDCSQVPECISLLFNFISNLFTPATMWRTLSSSEVRNNRLRKMPPSLWHVRLATQRTPWS